MGEPDSTHIPMSYGERQTLTMRMKMRRLTRLTKAFSKKVENLRAAVALHFAHYNFVRTHSSLRVSPAMAAGVTDHLWTLEELVEQTSNEDTTPDRPRVTTYFPPSFIAPVSHLPRSHLSPDSAAACAYRRVRHVTPTRP